MKLRVKFSGQSRQINLGEGAITDASNLTLRKLKDSVIESFSLENRDVELSLNKKDILSGDDVPISDLGIVPGDLVHVMTAGGNGGTQNNLSQLGIAPPPPPQQQQQQQQQRKQPLSSHCNNASMVVVETNKNQNNEDVVTETAGQPVRILSLTTNSSRAEVEEGDEAEGQSSETMQRSIYEPLVIRESTDLLVPALLQELFAGSDITCPNDALFVLLHALMIESGFSLPGDVDQTCLPAGWKRSGFYMCVYEYVLTPSLALDCSLMAVTTGASLVVHGLSRTVGDFKTDHLQLKAENFVRDTSQVNAAAAFRSLDRLSTLFKDAIVLALQNHLATSAGFREFQGLLSLPCEVRLRLMCFLDAKSVCSLGQTCKQWTAIYKDNNVWRRLYIQSFEKPLDSSLSRKWYEMFKDRYQQYLNEQERRRAIARRLDEDFLTDPGPWNPFGPPINPMHPLPPPRFLGGDYDLDPQFGGPPFGNNLMNGRHGLPQGPPNPFMNQGQGRTGRGRGNLTGSPFFNNGGGFI